MSDPGRQYAIYLFAAQVARLQLDRPAGPYRAERVDPASGNVMGDRTWSVGSAEAM